MKLSKNWLVQLGLSALLCCGTILVSIGTAHEQAWADMPSVTIGDNNVVKLEVAQTETEIEHGLMGRTDLPESQGMVFLFHPARKVAFWMYHCFISLDMVFVKDGKIIQISEDVPPCKSQDPSKCPTYPLKGQIEVEEVIELKAGYAKRHNVKVGDPVKYSLP